MIAVDSSTLVAFFREESGPDLDLLDEALRLKQVVLPPIVLSEILSDSELDSAVVNLICDFPILEILEGYWKRAGLTRAKVLEKGNKARVADALICQSCLDHKMGLLTRDRDFRSFSKICGLLLLS